MSIVTENGTGQSTAETLISLADTTTYHSLRGNTAWAALASDALREQALRRASDYMLQAYRAQWAGDRVNSTQALDWPRTGVTVDGYSVLSTSVPVLVANASAELALKAAAGDLLSDLSQNVKSETIGPLTTVYSEYSTQSTRYASIDLMLAPYLTGDSGVSVRLVK